MESVHIHYNRIDIAVSMIIRSLGVRISCRQASRLSKGLAGVSRERRRRASLHHPSAPHRHAVVADALKRVPTHVRRFLANNFFIYPRLLPLLLIVAAFPATVHADGGFPIIGVLHAGEHPEGIAVDTQTHIVYIAYESAGQVVAFDPIRGQVRWRTRVGSTVTDVQVDSTNQRVYVVSFSNQSRRNVLAVLAGSTGHILFTTSIEQGDVTRFADNDLAVDTKRQRVYVSDYQDVVVKAFTFATSPGTDQLQATVSLIHAGRSPQALGVNSRLGRLYVANSTENSISVIDEDNGRTLANIPVADGPVQPLRVDEATGRVYVVCSTGQELDIIDGNTNRVMAHIPVSPEPEGVAFNTATGRIYVADEGNPDGSNSDQDSGTTITVIDGQSLAVLGTLQVGRGPDGVEADPALRRVYVSVEDSNAVAEISDSVDVVLQTDNTALQVANVRQALALLRQATIITLVLMILTMVGATIRALSPRWRGRESPRTPPGGASSHSEKHTPPA